MYFHKPLRSTTNSSKLTQAFNSERPTTTLTSIGSCPNLNRSTVHLLALERLPDAVGVLCAHWGMLRLKVHFKSRYIDNETHDDRRRGTQRGRPLLGDTLLRAQRCAATRTGGRRKISPVMQRGMPWVNRRGECP